MNSLRMFKQIFGYIVNEGNNFMILFTIFINFTVISMQNPLILEGDDIESHMIQIATNIYQNLAIKRWIEDISIFKEVSTYLEICQIMFPQNNIDFYRIDNDSRLTKGQKIEGIKDLIAKLIKSDLSHISGTKISQGDNVHQFYFLQLLEALSVNMIQNEEYSVKSARDIRQSSGQTNSYYTVIGINKEFQKAKYGSDEANSNNQQRNQLKYREAKQNHKGRPQEQLENLDSHTSSADFPIKPIKKTDYPTSNQKKKPKNPQNKPAIVNLHKEIARKDIFISKNDIKYQKQNQQVLNLIKKVYQSEEELQKHYEIQLQKQQIQEFRQLQRQHNKTQIKIENQADFRKKTYQDKMMERNQLMRSLNGEGQIKKAVKNMCRQETYMKKQVRIKSYERELKNIEEIMDFNELNQLLKQAVHSNSSKDTIKKK